MAFEFLIFEHRDFLQLSVFKHREVGLFQTFDQLSGFVFDGHVDHHQAGVGGERRGAGVGNLHRLALLREDRNQNRDQHPHQKLNLSSKVTVRMLETAVGRP